MSNLTKRISIIIVLLIGLILCMETTVNATTFADLVWNTINNTVLEKGQVYNERFVNNIEGLTYVIDSHMDDLPGGLSLSSDGRIIGTVSEEQVYDEYDVRILIYDEATCIANYTMDFVVVDDFDEAEWVDFDNLFTETKTVYEGGDSDAPVFVKDGFLVYRPTLANHISYNEQNKTYNITFTQDFTDETVANYIELLFKESEYEKLVKFEIIENVGFKNIEDDIITIANYNYTDNGDDLYSAFFYTEVDKTYTGTGRHLKIKAVNPNDVGEYRYIEFNIVNSNRIFVAFETNGGSAIVSMEKAIGDTITLPTPPTKEGWVFDGWYTDSDLQTQFNSNTELLTNTVLYAKWRNDYKFIEGAEQTYILNKDENARFRINANYDLLDKVYVDDQELDSSKYTTERGSTIILLLKDYVKTLSMGTHTLKVTYTDNRTVETIFVMALNNNEKDKTPKTGIENDVKPVVIIGMISLLGAIALGKR